MAKRKVKMVCVEWVDIVGHGAMWCDISDIDKMGYADCYTTGFLFSRDDDAVRVLSTVSPGLRSASDCTVIPAGVVKRIRSLGTFEADFADASGGAPLRTPRRRTRGRR